MCALLVESGAIDVDLFKCPDWPDLLKQVSALRPCYAHFDFRAGRDLMGAVDWRRLTRLHCLQETQYGFREIILLNRR